MSKLTRPSAAVTGRLMSSGIASIERTASCSGRVTIGASHVMSERRRSRQRRMRLIECPTVTNKFSKRSRKSSYYVVRPTILSECCSGRCWGSAIAAAGETTRARRSSLGASLGTLTIKLSSTKSTSSHRHRCNDGTSKLRSRLIFWRHAVLPRDLAVRHPYPFLRRSLCFNPHSSIVNIDRSLLVIKKSKADHKQMPIKRFSPRPIAPKWGRERLGRTQRQRPPTRSSKGDIYVTPKAFFPIRSRDFIPFVKQIWRDNHPACPCVNYDIYFILSFPS